MIACRGRDEPRTPKIAPPTDAAAVDATTAGATEIVARLLCDHYWTHTSTNARPYDTYELCIADQTKDRPCDVATATACADRVAALRPGDVGNGGLRGIPACATCLAPGSDTSVQQAFAEQQAALDASTLTIHAAKVDTGRWPTELDRPKGGKAILVRIDVELSGYGYRIDPDDFLLVTTGSTPATVASWPYAERLTRDGRPVDWRDPSVVDDPDLRMLVYFGVPASLRGSSLAVSYNDKTSKPFELR